MAIQARTLITLCYITFVALFVLLFFRLGLHGRDAELMIVRGLASDLGGRWTVASRVV